MTQDNKGEAQLYNLSRRQVLGGLGAVGLASAGAGLGTSAFFSDEEAVSAVVEAGRLDLLMDFRAEYYPWENLYEDVYPRSLDELFDTDGDGDIDSDDEFGPVYVMGQSPDLRYASETDVLDEDAGTTRTVDAGTVLTGEDWAAAARQIRACAAPFADTTNTITVNRQDGSSFDVTVDGETQFPDNLPVDGSDAADYFYADYVDGAEGIMFNLDDVKPKDAGEATLSLHLCDNDAYLWAQPFIRANAENGIVEPEAGAGDGTGGPSGGELADYLWLNLFYDTNCNNQKDGAVAEGGADVMIVLDRSGSMEFDGSTFFPQKFDNAKDGAKLLVDALDANSNVGLVSYAGSASLNAGLGSSDTDVKNAIDGLNAGGSTNIDAAIDLAQSELANNGTNSTRIMVVLTNGNETTGDAVAAANAAKTASPSTQIYGIAYGSGANENLIEDISSSPKLDDGSITADDEFAFLSADIGDIEAVFAEIAQSIAGEICIYEGSLAGLAEDLATLPYNGSFPLDGAADRNCALTDPTDVSCFRGNETTCIAFEWYLPCTVEELRELGSCYTLQNGPNAGDVAGTLFDELVDRGVIADEDDFDINVVQTDSVEFGATFAAVQCRHNMSNVSPFNTTSA
jgi:predicted ribosomally synthesized peptide with SipW-like signal peptide